MEPMTLLDKEFFKRKNLVDLARIIASNYACDFQVLPFAQKYYGLARQIFVKNFLWPEIRLVWLSSILVK